VLDVVVVGSSVAEWCRRLSVLTCVVGSSVLDVVVVGSSVLDVVVVGSSVLDVVVRRLERAGCGLALQRARRGRRRLERVDVSSSAPACSRSSSSARACWTWWSSAPACSTWSVVGSSVLDVCRRSSVLEVVVVGSTVLEVVRARLQRRTSSSRRLDGAEWSARLQRRGVGRPTGSRCLCPPSLDEWFDVVS
jgi:hypothetical protein